MNINMVVDCFAKLSQMNAQEALEWTTLCQTGMQELSGLVPLNKASIEQEAMWAQAAAGCAFYQYVLLRQAGQTENIQTAELAVRANQHAVRAAYRLRDSLISAAQQAFCVGPQVLRQVNG